MTGLTIPGVVLTPIQRHADERGAFAEIARQDALPKEFVQLNHSRSRQGVLRGLHFHERQADLWYVVSGRAQVALVDLRGSGRGVDVFEMSGDEPSTLYIPPRVAHGFLALEDLDLVYAVTAYFDSTDEHGVAWDDPDLAIPWAIRAPLVSGRDASNPAWKTLRPS